MSSPSEYRYKTSYSPVHISQTYLLSDHLGELCVVLGLNCLSIKLEVGSERVRGWLMSADSVTPVTVNLFWMGYLGVLCTVLYLVRKKFRDSKLYKMTCLDDGLYHRNRVDILFSPTEWGRENNGICRLVSTTPFLLQRISPPPVTLVSTSFPYDRRVFFTTSGGPPSSLCSSGLLVHHVVKSQVHRVCLWSSFISSGRTLCTVLG